MNRRPRLRIDFADFYPGFEKSHNFFTRTLAHRWEVVICDRPDLLIFSHLGQAHRLYPCPRIFWTEETILPDWHQCDAAWTCHRLEDPRHYRLPYYVVRGRAEALIRQPWEGESIPRLKTKFCALVVSNAHPKKTSRRIAFFHALSGYKTVDSGGRYANNIGGPLPVGHDAKREFLLPYRFALAFENKALPGYTTEKLFEAMEARCIPIYWGDPTVAEDFNPGSFIQATDYPNDAALVERVAAVDGDPTLQAQYHTEPYFHNNQPNAAFSAAALCDHVERLLASPQPPVGRRRKWWQPGRWLVVKGHRAEPRLPHI